MPNLIASSFLCAGIPAPGWDSHLMMTRKSACAAAVSLTSQDKA